MAINAQYWPVVMWYPRSVIDFFGKYVTILLVVPNLWGIPMPSSILNGKSVLILENEPLIGLDVATILRDTGCVSQIVPRVNCALLLLDEERFDVAILDLFEAAVKEEPRRTELAEKICALRLPYIFLVGGHTEILEPGYHRDTVRVSKPYAAADLITALITAYKR